MRRWGGIFTSQGRSIPVGADFHQDLQPANIGIKEAAALYFTLQQVADDNSSLLRNKRIDIYVDNQALFRTLQKGGGRCPTINGYCKDIFWLGVRHNFLLQLHWVPSEHNTSDAITREPAQHDARLDPDLFQRIYRWTGDRINIDWMASAANVQQVDHQPLPFVSRYSCSQAVGTNVLHQHMGLIPSSSTPAFGFCFPPLPMTRAIIAHAKYCAAKGVFVLASTDWEAMVPDKARVGRFWPSQNATDSFTMLSKSGHTMPCELFNTAHIVWLDFSRSS